MHKTDVARAQIETAVALFLSDTDFVSAISLAGAAEDILGALLRRSGQKSMLENLHNWYQETTGTQISFKDFAGDANFTRNTLKHATEATEDHIEVYRWEAVQMLMRALFNWKAMGLAPTTKMLEFNSWLCHNRDSYENLQ